MFYPPQVPMTRMIDFIKREDVIEWLETFHAPLYLIDRAAMPESLPSADPKEVEVWLSRFQKEE